MEGNRSKGKNTKKWANRNDMEIGRRRESWKRRGRERETGTWSKVQLKTRHKSNMAWKHGTSGLSVLLSSRGVLFSSRARPHLRLDVLIVLIRCCLSSITQKSQINHCVNINQGAQSRRAGNSFRETEGIHSHTAWQTGQQEKALNLFDRF